MNYLRNLKPNKIIEKINKKSVKKWALASSSITRGPNHIFGTEVKYMFITRSGPEP